jgi:putative phage-type endonuclease
MEIFNLIQNTPEWAAHRARHWNASDTPAMLGCSPHKSRAALLRELASGVPPEVDDATRARFANGHRLEALARPLAEEIVGEPLYPVTGTNGRFSASFDGLTLAGDTAFEHKAINAGLRRYFAGDGELPLHYRAQMEHQLMVSGADRVLFMVSEFDGDGTLVEEFHTWYEPDRELRQQITDGWRVFEADLRTFDPDAAPAAATTAVGVSPETLPALRIEVEGTVLSSNLSAFRETAITAIRGVNRELTTDQDFADAELSVKWCREVETRIDAAKAHALSQTASIDELFRTLDDISAEARRVRLDLEKLVKGRKEDLRTQIGLRARQAIDEHVRAVNADLAPHTIDARDLGRGIAEAIKGKRSLQSMQDAVDAVVAQEKIRADGLARLVRGNIQTFHELAAGVEFLFADIGAWLSRSPSEFRELVESRVARHRSSEELRKAREAEEAARKAREAEAAAVDITPPRAAPAPEPAVDPVLEQEQDQADEEPPTLNLGAINGRLGFTMSAAFVTDTLGITPAGTARRGVLFTERQFQAICRAITAHVDAVRRSETEVTA